MGGGVARCSLVRYRRGLVGLRLQTRIAACAVGGKVVVPQEEMREGRGRSVRGEGGGGVKGKKRGDGVGRGQYEKEYI